MVRYGGSGPDDSDGDDDGTRGLWDEIFKLCECQGCSCSEEGRHLPSATRACLVACWREIDLRQERQFLASHLIPIGIYILHTCKHLLYYLAGISVRSQNHSFLCTVLPFQLDSAILFFRRSICIVAPLFLRHCCQHLVIARPVFDARWCQSYSRERLSAGHLSLTSPAPSNTSMPSSWRQGLRRCYQV